MKSYVTCFIILLSFQFTGRLPKTATSIKSNVASSENIFIITLDGFRWQEVFTGADPALINNEEYTPDTATMKMLYWAADAEGRRKKLLPFLWNVIGVKGQIYGNRYYGNNVNTSNIYSISYPGYNEIFTGNTDISISSNVKNPNHNITILEYLNTKKQFKGKVAAFTSWDVFPYIFNKERSHIFLNSGYENKDDAKVLQQSLIDKVEDEYIFDKTNTRHDQLTCLTAKEYIRSHQPKIVFLGLGETDEAGHAGRYDTYLEKAAEADRMIAGLWHWVQTTPGYRDNTTFIISTDHGRGKNADTWSDHGMLIKGSSQTWLAVIGPHISPLGEIKEDQQLYQKQLAQTIALLIGEKFECGQPVAAAISFKKQK